MVESRAKKYSNIIRRIVLNLDYFLYSLFRLFLPKMNLNPIEIKEILVIELDYLGDLIAITPALRALRNRFKKADISVLVLPEMKDIFKGNPDIDYLMAFDKKEGFAYNLKKIKNKAFDLAIILRPGSFYLSLLLLMAGIKYRIGCRKTGILEGKGYFLTRKLKPNHNVEHTVDQNLDVVGLVGAHTDNKYPKIYFDKKDEKAITKLIKIHKLLGSKIVAINPGSKGIANISYPSHLWPLDNYARIADYLAKKYKAKVIITGTKDQANLAQAVAKLSKNKPISFTGRTSTKQLAALYKRCRLVISTDTGSAHVAAAVNVPTITLFGPQNPKIWEPYSKKEISIYKEDCICTACQRYYCRRKDNICMKSIKINDVVKAIDRHLK